jgi:rare lipoprotein A
MEADRNLRRGLRASGIIALAAMILSACATPKPRLDIGRTVASSPRGPMVSPSGRPLRGTEKPYQIRGVWYYPKADPDYDVKGIGSWYGEQFHNRRTANGEIFDMDLPSAAHTTLPLPSLVEVTNLDNGRRMIVRVNDRGPFVDNRVIDLSRAAAEQLGYRRQGVARVRVRYIGPAAKTAFEPRQYAAAPASELRPPKAAEIVDAPRTWPAEAETITRPAEATPVRPAAFRVQAGAFSNRENAERAVVQLRSAGRVTIEPLQRSEGTLYRVTVMAGDDEGEAWSVRDRVAALGYSGATVLRP